jgi:hypothetical protein
VLTDRVYLECNAEGHWEIPDDVKCMSMEEHPEEPPEEQPEVQPEEQPEDQPEVHPMDRPSTLQPSMFQGQLQETQEEAPMVIRPTFPKSHWLFLITQEIKIGKMYRTACTVPKKNEFLLSAGMQEQTRILKEKTNLPPQILKQLNYITVLPNKNALVKENNRRIKCSDDRRAKEVELECGPMGEMVYRGRC